MKKLDARAGGLQKLERRVSQLTGHGVPAEAVQERPGGVVGFEENRWGRMVETPAHLVGLVEDSNGMAGSRKVQGGGEACESSAENEHLTRHGDVDGKRERNQTPAATANRWLEDRVTRSPSTR